MRRGIGKIFELLCRVYDSSIPRYLDISTIIGIYQPLQNFLDELFKLPSNSSNPLPFHRNDHLSHFLFPLFKFFKNTSASSFFLKPFPNQRPNHFSIPFFSSLLLSSNFFLQIIPTSNYNCPPFPSLFRRNIRLLSTSSNFLKPRIPFLE